MKKVLIVLLLFYVSVSISAQFSMGAKVGYDVTLEQQQVFKELFNVSSNMQNGFHVGVYARIGQRAYMQPEVLYNYSTYRSNIVLSADQSDNKKYVISTFDIPLLAGFSIVNTNFFKLRVMGGPKLSINAGSTKATSFVQTGSSDNTDFIESIRDVRIGLDCGIGVDIWRFCLDVRYNLLPELYKRQYFDGTVLKSKPLNSFQVSLGFRIFGRNNSKD